MKNISMFLTALLFTFTCISAQKVEEFPPKWVNNPPKTKKNIVYAIGHGQSLSQAIASDKARANAFTELANLLGPTKVTINQNAKGEESSAGTKSTKTEVEATLTDVTIVERACKKNEEGMYDAYILVSYDKKKKRKK